MCSPSKRVGAQQLVLVMEDVYSNCNFSCGAPFCAKYSERDCGKTGFFFKVVSDASSKWNSSHFLLLLATTATFSSIFRLFKLTICIQKAK